MASPYLSQFLDANGQIQPWARSVLSPDTLAKLEAQRMAAQQPTDDSGVIAPWARNVLSPQMQAKLEQKRVAGMGLQFEAAPPLGAQASGPSILTPAIAPQKPHPNPAPDHIYPPKAQPGTGGSGPVGMGAAQPIPSGPGDFGAGAAIERQKKAIREGAAIGVRKAAETATILDETERHAQEAELRRQDKAQRQQDAMNQHMQEYNKLTNDLQQKSSVDPSRYWASKGNGEKAITAIALVLGGVGQALGGGRNQGVDMIQQSVRDDIQLQREAIDDETKRKAMAVSGKQNVLQMMRQQFSDESAADKAAQEFLLGTQQRRVEALKAKYPSVQQEADLMIGKLDQERASLRAQAFQAEAKRRDEMELAREKLQAKNAPAEGTFVPNVGYAANKEAAKDVAEAGAARGTAKNLIGRLRALRVDHGSEWFNTKAAAQMKSAAASLQVAMLKTNHLGTLDKGSQETTEKMMGGDPTAMGSDEAYAAALDELEKTVDTNYEETLKAKMISRPQTAQEATQANPTLRPLNLEN